MAALMDRALDRVRSWPEERQREAAELLLALDDLGSEPVEVDEETLAALDEASAEVARGERADVSEVEAFFSRFRK